MTIYRFGPFRLEKEQLLLSCEGVTLPLGPKVVETLLALLEHPGEVLTKTELLDRIWPEGFVEEANLAQNIYVIRKTIRAHWDCEAIETVPRRGYRFAVAVTVECLQQAHVAEPALTSPIAIAPRRRFTAYAIGAAFAAVLAAVIGIGSAEMATSHPSHAPVPALSASGERLYAMGKYYWNQRTATGIAKSIRYFEEVVQSDRHDARGYAGLASAYAIDGDYGFGPLKKDAALSRAASYARKALAIDSKSAEGHAVLGLVAVDRGHMKQGLVEYRSALALDPDYAPAHQWYGASLLLGGKSGAAYDELQKAANLDPESVATTDWLSHAAFMARRYKDAIAYGHQALDLSPQRYGVYQTIGMAYEALGNYRAAVAAYEAYGRTCAQCRFDAAALLAHVYGVTHEYSHAQEELQQAQRGVASRQTSPENVILALLAMGRRNDALHMLRSARMDESSALFAIDPRMDLVRGDARFRQYVQGPG